MKKWSFNTIRIILITLCVVALTPAWSQQQVIINKDNTRPELKAGTHRSPLITFLTADKGNGYNEIRWTVYGQDDTRKYIVEYSTDAINYQSAGEVMANDDITYQLRHRIFDDRPMLYRVHSELLNDKSFYSTNILLDGIAVSPVKLYPTVITGNTVNIQAYWPVERIQVYDGSGAQVYSKDVAGQRDYITLVVPALARGMYWITFYGNDWKTTEKFVIE